ncbi:MAG: CinA family nicotinamide mononucleotide deamidase-related protein [Bacteroidales bacterium]|nr:CinA family nicotinamide mononucleotide deamidase-related protein [Bacteroidales bacterium]
MINASICTIGDEILIGQIVDTNSSEISKALGAIGVRTTRMLSIGDDHDTIIENLEGELTRNSIVVVTGGLGPTKDDITKQALAELSQSTGWYEHAGQLAKVHEILSSRGLEVLENNKAQALVPDRCEVIVNQRGTAPIMVFRFPEERFGHKAVLYSMPGVPYETIGMLPEVVNDIKNNFELDYIIHRTLMTYGIAESALSKLIEPWEEALPEDMHLAYLPNTVTGVRLRLSVYGGDPTENEKRIDEQIAGLNALASEYIYSDKDDSLQAAVGELLRKHGKTMSCAESCTGGLISELIVSIPGSSDYHLGSVTSYANSVKINVLGVPSEIIATHGAVSAECVEKMAEGVRRLTGSDYSVATSGIAGPGGATPDKPCGLVWIGVSSARGTHSHSFVYKNDRKRNMERFAATALNLLRLEVLESEE